MTSRLNQREERAARIALVVVAALVSGLVTPGIANAVSGGWLVSWSSHPWAVSVGSDICGGVLVAPDRVLTSARCPSATYPELREEIRVGDAHRRIVGVAMQRARVRQRLDPKSPCFDVDARCTPDIALLRLDRPIRDAPVPRLSVARAGQHAFVFGHGTVAIDDDQTNPALLRAALLQIRSDRVCLRRFTSRDERAVLAPQRTVCTTDPKPPYGAGFCVGDGGAPLIAWSRGALRLFGVASWSRACGEGGWPSVFAEVARYRRFTLSPTPVWRPEDLGYSSISGIGAVGATLTCTPARFTNRPDRLIFVFRTVSGVAERQRGPAAMYLVHESDRGESITCDVYAINGGGYARANAVTGIEIAGVDASERRVLAAVAKPALRRRIYGCLARRHVAPRSRTHFVMARPAP